LLATSSAPLASPKDAGRGKDFVPVTPLPIVAYSHLRWDFVHQRPQHVLSRLAASRPVVFVEEPVPRPGARAHCEVSEPVPGVLRCRTHAPVLTEGFTDAACRALRRALATALAARGVGAHVAWLYTPMALPLARALAPRAVAYDCMDELSAFAGAPPGLLARERELLRVADVVFTGGPSLHRAKRARHPRVLCLPSSVDAAHFRRARSDMPAPEDQARIPQPRIGYFGVLDERLDRSLLDGLAAARPAWQLVLVGPIVKIDPGSLPRRPNIHYLGPRDYADLPAYLAGWDACLLPFALNDATRFISPTKTLEYMAAERPVVSTPVRDVAEPYGGVVRIAATVPDFVAACDDALREGREARAAAMRRIVDGTSWDATVRIMDAEIEHAVLRRNNARGETPWAPMRSSSSALGRPA
jgi:UDP-galactopyranose mutase